MNQTTKSLLLATMMSAAGFAVAQTSDASSSTTRAAVKSEAKANVKALEAGTDGGAGPKGSSGLGDNSPSTATRAAVKSEINVNAIKNDFGDPASRKQMKALTSDERKTLAVEDRAARKARYAGKANNPPVKDGKSVD